MDYRELSSAGVVLMRSAMDGFGLRSTASGDTLLWLLPFFHTWRSAMTLIKHCGVRAVTWGELELMRTPPATATWFPLPHSQVLGSVVQTLDKAGFQIQSMELAVTPDDARFIGTLQLQAEIAAGVALAVGCRNSVDKSLPIGFCCGQHVFVCDNLAFSSDVVITRKHTRYRQTRFGEAIAATVAGLEESRENEARRIERPHGCRSLSIPVLPPPALPSVLNAAWPSTAGIRPESAVAPYPTGHHSHPSVPL